MEPFGFAHFINTTWNTVIKFLDKVNWMFLQMSCSTCHSCCRFTGALFTFSISMYVHTCSMMFMSGVWAGQFGSVKLPSRFLLARYLYPGSVLGVVIVLENKLFFNESLPDRYGVVDEYLLAFRCCMVIGELVQMPESVVCDRAPNL